MKADEKFFAWLDGELTGSEAAKIEERVASDPELRALADRHRALKARLGGAFDRVAGAPVPERLRSAARMESTPVVDLAERRERKRVRARVGALPQWATIAATLAIGILAGWTVAGRSPGPVEIRDGNVYAAASLDRALDTQLASAPSGKAIRIGITFRNSGGAVCRTFSGPAAQGLACRANGRWRLRGLFPSGEQEAGDYRMAGGMNPQLAELVESALSGEPMGAAQEKAAKEHGWE